MQNGLFMLKLNDGSVGTKSPENQLSVQVSPNPAHDLLNIKLQTSSLGVWSWKLSNAAGQICSTGKESATETSIQIAGIPKGLYFVEIRDADGKAAVRKVIVE